MLVLTIANHGLVNGDAVVLDTGSICFTCSKDSNNSTHCYPRATDPAAGQYLTVSNVTTNTFRVNVGAFQVTNILIHLSLLLQIQLRQSVVVDMLVLQPQSSKTTRDHYLLLV